MRYMFLSFEWRLSEDQRSFGELFHACCEEMRDLTYMEALMRILTLALGRLRKIGILCEKPAWPFSTQSPKRPWGVWTSDDTDPSSSL